MNKIEKAFRYNKKVYVRNVEELCNLMELVEEEGYLWYTDEKPTEAYHKLIEFLPLVINFGEIKIVDIDKCRRVRRKIGVFPNDKKYSYILYKNENK